MINIFSSACLGIENSLLFVGEPKSCVFVLIFQKIRHLISVYLALLELYSSVDPKTIRIFSWFLELKPILAISCYQNQFSTDTGMIPRKKLLLFELNGFLKGMYYPVNKSFLFDWQTKLL